MNEHTKTPWYYEKLYSKGQLDSVVVHPCHFYSQSAFSEKDMADAKFIVKACNSHVALVDALVNILAILDDVMTKGSDGIYGGEDDCIAAAKEALEQAK